MFLCCEQLLNIMSSNVFLEPNTRRSTEVFLLKPSTQLQAPWSLQIGSLASRPLVKRPHPNSAVSLGVPLSKNRKHWPKTGRVLKSAGEGAGFLVPAFRCFTVSWLVHAQTPCKWSWETSHLLRCHTYVHVVALKEFCLVPHQVALTPDCPPCR